ncbi:MAG: TetR family transcriptional regulator [Firmicutes bacterium]|nr:TetR family transcriptional regulator [Bacillota bacterium]
MPRTAPADRVREILAAALAEFARHGYQGARMQAIAAAAGVADGTLYLYFRNKRDLLAAVVRAGMGEYMARLEERLAGSADGVEELGRLVRFHLEYLAERPELARVAEVELRQPDPAIRAAVREAIGPFVQRIDAVLARGRREGRFRADVDARVARRMVFGTLDECVSAWVQARHPYPLAALAPDVERLLLGGIRA